MFDSRNQQTLIFFLVEATRPCGFHPTEKTTDKHAKKNQLLQKALVWLHSTSIMGSMSQGKPCGTMTKSAYK